MLSPFAEFLLHLENCDSCRRVDLDLCTAGERLKAEAWKGAADRIASIVPKIPASKGPAS